MLLSTVSARIYIPSDSQSHIHIPGFILIEIEGYWLAIGYICMMYDSCMNVHGGVDVCSVCSAEKKKKEDREYRRGDRGYTYSYSLATS
jgi:hypothetical protein